MTIDIVSIYVLDDEKIDLFEFNNDVWVTDQDVTDDSEYNCSILIFSYFLLFAF